MRRSTLRAAVAVVTAGITLTACGSSDGGSGGGGGGGGDAATATSAEDFGGMDALVKAAQKEGELNVIALPPSWANYEEMLKTFSDKYKIKINSANPDGSSQDEVNAVTSQKGQDRAPDVLDLGTSFAKQAAAQKLLAPYEVATWDDIPDNQKDPDGLWFNDYGGFISIGCNASVVKKCPTSSRPTAGPAVQGSGGAQRQPDAGCGRVQRRVGRRAGQRREPRRHRPRHRLLQEGQGRRQLQPGRGRPRRRCRTARRRLAIDWDYVNAGLTKTLAAGNVDWQVNVPTDGLFGSFYSQAINKFAPHPAAARLWEEFLYSDEGQNIWLKGLSRPVRLDAMTKAGTADEAAVKALPAVDGKVEFPDDEQQSAAQKVVADRWNAEMSG